MKADVIYAPNRKEINDANPSIFLAGSIEMDMAENWQERIISELKDYEVTIFNPRRKDWNSSWTQEMSDPNFNEQVNWELDKLQECDLAVFYFDPNTKSPVTLYELGRFATSGKLLVCCPKGFWRKGNVDVGCFRDGIQQVETFEELINILKVSLKN